MSRSGVVLLGMFLLSPGPAAGAEALHLNWDVCGPSGASSKSFDCQTNTPSHVLYASFVLDQPVDEVIGVELVVDLQQTSAELPDWWRLGVGGCRQDELSANDLVPAGDCTDLWQGQTTGGIQGFAVGQPRGGANQARIKAVLTVLPALARSLNAGELYHAATLVLSSDRTTGVDSCAGCDGGACLVLNSIWLKRLAGAPGGDVLLQTPGPGGANFATWQGATVAACDAVPTRTRTWGAIKSLYR